MEPNSELSYLPFMSCKPTLLEPSGIKRNQTRNQAVCPSLLASQHLWKQAESIGAKAGTKLFTVHFLQVNVFGTRWNQMEPNSEPSCLPFIACKATHLEPSGTKAGTKLFPSLCWKIHDHTPSSNYDTIKKSG